MPASLSRTSATPRLDEIRQVLAQTQAAAEERERALAGPTATETAQGHEESLQRLFDELYGTV
jgi:hypothetical protein